MPGEPIFMAVRAPGATVAPQARAVTATRVTTTSAGARLATVRQPVELTNPALAFDQRKIIRPHFDVSLFGTRTRDQLKVPISPFPEPVDTVLFEEPADPAKKLYLPRYRLREQGGRYEIGITAVEDGGWRLSAGLERFPAPELGAGAQGASQITHEIAVFFLYGAGPLNSIEKRVDFTERADDAKGVTVSVRLTLSERDNLLHALQSEAAAPKLVVRRAMTVAVKVTEESHPTIQRPVLVRDHRVRPEAAAIPTVRAAQVQKVPGVTLRPPPPPVASPVLPPEPDRYRTVQRALDDVADPEPFVLDPRLHSYLYEGAAAGAGGATASEFRRIVLSHPQGAPDARFHAYFQDKGEPWIFYYLPDRFKLSRRDVAPFLPQMVVRIAAPDGALENASVTVDYVVEPSLDAGRLKAAAEALRREIPAATSRQTEPELRPLQARATLQLWVPGAAGGAALAEMKDVSIDLANGFLHSLTLPLDGFRQLYGAAYSLDATSLFSGQVLVATGLSTPEPIPLEIRFADTQGEILSFAEQTSGTGAAIAVRLQNAIESPVRLLSLPVAVRRGDREVAARIEGIDFQAPIELAPGAELAFTVTPQEELPGDGVLDAVFDTTGVKILPDPEKILPLISDQSVPAQYEREIEVMTLPDLLGDSADPTSILLINVEFKGGGSLKLTREQNAGIARVLLPLMDLLLGRDVQGRYAFRQQIIRRNGTQTVDPDWREADFSLLVVPVV